MITGKARITDVIRARTEQWKPQRDELYNTAPSTRFGYSVYPDTRHITECSVPLSHSYCPEMERFKTSNATQSIFAVPDPSVPQQEDAMKKHARNEFRVNRIKLRQAEFAERCHAANEAGRDFDEKRIARKAMNQLNYDRRVKLLNG